MSDRSDTETAWQPVQPSSNNPDSTPTLTYFSARTVRVSRWELPPATTRRRRSTG
ncbi:MAG: hypothetical protein M3Y42_09675 [Actinomycetota bacterium]|nr:hypothetical protein [Actinomycetota bacterium]MDQ2957220.1 hypothetical protein [Actinomycetota bacterium]